MLILVCALVAAGAIGFTLFVRDRDIPPAPVENPELKALETQRQVLLENYKDLQFEYQQGKLSDEDYQSLKESFVSEQAVVLDAIEQVKNRAATPSASPRAGSRERLRGSRPAKTVEPKPEPQPTSQPKAKPAQTATAERLCPSCSAANPGSNRFCGSCGAALPV